MDKQENKTEFTPSEALEFLDGVSKNSFYDDMNNGIVSYVERDWGKRKRRYIQGSELVRVYGSKFNFLNNNPCLNDHPEKQSTTTQNDKEKQDEIALLRQKIEFLEEKIEDRESQLTESKERENKLQDRLDKLTDTLSKQTLILEDMRQKPSEKPVEKRKGFFGRLVS